MLPGPEAAFVDGRPFHTLDLCTGHWRAHLSCGRGVCNGTYIVASPGTWHLQWRATGPAENQELRSVCCRR